MELVHEYWWVLVIVVALVLAFILLRPKQQVRLTDSAPVRPHMAPAKPAEGRGLAGEIAAATSDVAGEILEAPVHQQLDGQVTEPDDLGRLKGVGPKFRDALNGLGVRRYDQLAALTPSEIERLDSQLGAFRGRLTRDRIVEQADHLSRNDTEGFEQKFGKL